MNDEQNQQEKRDGQTCYGWTQQQLKTGEREHFRRQFANLNEGGVALPAQRYQVDFVILHREMYRLNVFVDGETGSIDQRCGVEPMSLAVAGNQQVGVAGSVQVRDANRGHSVNQAVEIHSVLDGIRVFALVASVPLNAGDGPVGRSQQHESLLLRIGRGLCLGDGLSHER